MAIKIAGTEVINDNKELVLAKLAEINTTVADTAVDVFVYDTSKDSDGGAWRKRTQHTSWYNEAASATRGSRKEFPAVAVIVAEANQVTIYDGDDPDLPMWMVFNASGGNGASMIGRTNEATTCVAMLNGHMAVGRNSFGLHEVFFIDDRGFFRENGNVNAYTKAIVDRNGTNSWGPNLAPVGELENDTVNDVAMTVLPNAPIDAATGLPVPTIAVATEGGFSVILDTGLLSDFTTTSAVDHVRFNYDNVLFAAFTGDGLYSFPSSVYTAGDFTFASAILRVNDGGWSGTKTFNAWEIVDIEPVTNGEVAIGLHSSDTTDGLIIYSKHGTPVAGTTGESDARAYYAQTTSTYATGYLSGAIKLATLSDTDDTDVTGSELSPALDFDVETNWTLNGSYVTASDADTFVNSQANQGAYASVFSGGLGETYTVSVDIDGPQVEFRNGTSGSSPLMASSYTTGQRTVTFTVVPSSYGNNVVMYLRGTATGTYNINSVSVRLAEEDRSVNGNGLQVFGTVTKNPVATGADLVAYSGFGGVTPSVYLKQPVGPNLTTGTLALVWYKAGILGSTYGFMGQGSNTSAGYGFGTNASTGTLNGRITTSGGTTNLGSDVAIADGTWKCLAITYEGSLLHIYINGTLHKTYTSISGDITSSDGFYIGAGITSVGFRGGSGTALSLARVSATVASPEQIAKIYEDEKVLFQENAQATLYGSSDAVTALAYDDTTELLHVGTSAGRSVFQGLRRVDNTTTAVSAAISASNNLVGEQ